MIANGAEIVNLAREILATTNPDDIDFARFRVWAGRANSYAVSYCPKLLDLISKAEMHVVALEARLADEAADDADYHESQREDDRRDFRSSPCNTGDYLEE